MNDYKKILFRIIIVLSLLISIEIGIYFFYQNKKSIKLRYPSLLEINNIGVKYLNKLIEDYFSFNDIQFYSNFFTLHYKDKVFSSVVLITEHQGKIIKIFDKPGEFNPFKKYLIRLDIQIKNYKLPIKIFYTKEEMSLVKFMSKNKQTIKFSDFKIGDEIIVKETYNLKNLKLLGAEIIKLTN